MEDGETGVQWLSVFERVWVETKKKKVTVNPLAVCVQRCILGRMCDAQL